MIHRAGPALLLLFGAMGCAKMAPASAGLEAPGYYDYDADYGGAADMEMDTAPASIEREESMGSRRSARRERRAYKADAAPPAPPPDPSSPGVEPGDPAAEPAVADDHDQDVGRYIIYTATMQVSVYNLEDAMTRAESVPEKYGGYVQNMSSNYFVMRIPSAELRPAMEDLATLGIVDNRTLDAQDITEEFLDIQTRIDVLEGTKAQLLDLLTKARTVEEALKVRQALDEVTMELEVLKGRLRRLDSLVSYSTLTVSLVERGPFTPTPSSNDPFPWVDSLGVEATEWK
ncbi:MAG: DUF4349 domain-containing protein [Myxococcales bacterium]|nr:DUF4349 domain-containing protein [Myxococcales bacterium]